jgi:hypothetical protein
MWMWMSNQLAWVWDVTVHGGEFVTALKTLVAVAALIPISTSLVLVSKTAQRIVRSLAQWILRTTPAALAPPPKIDEATPKTDESETLPTYSVYIPQDQSPIKNEEKFYQYFADRLSRAKNDIYNSGDGFSIVRAWHKEIEFASSARKADILDGAIVSALEKGANYHRFQIRNACSMNWMSRLIWMKQTFGNQVQLYFNSGFDHMGSFCAIDPTSRDCVYEWQLVTNRPGLDGTFTRGYGFLIGNNQICREIQQLFIDISMARRTNLLKHDSDDADKTMTVAKLTQFQIEMWNDRVEAACEGNRKSEISRELTKVMLSRGLTRDNIDRTNMAFYRDDFPILKYPAYNTALYFSFGSNMDREQLKKRTPQADYVGVGYVPDHDLVFNRKGSYRLGGVASIVPASGVRAYGVVWAISPEELAEMDRFEDPNAYERVQKTVITNDGKELLCNVYIAFPQGDIPADQPYLELIIKAAQTANLPCDWIERIKKYRTT